MENKEKKEDRKKEREDVDEGDERILNKSLYNEYSFKVQHYRSAIRFTEYMEEVLKMVLWNPRMRIYIKYKKMMDELEVHISGLPYMDWYDDDKRKFYYRVKRLRYIIDLIDRRIKGKNLSTYEVSSPSLFAGMPGASFKNGVLFVPSSD